MPGVQVAAVCDVDTMKQVRFKGIVENWQKESGMVQRCDMYERYEEILDRTDIDAVEVVTPDHWHALPAIEACKAGKDVYVEKPLSHSQWEGRQTVAAAEKYKKICQVGTQQRSDPMQAEIRKFLHDDNVLGEIKSARVNRYGVRPSIGKRQYCAST